MMHRSLVQMTSLTPHDGHPWPCHDVAMPIEIGNVRGTTRNVGVDNVVFASPVSFRVGSLISFVISTPAETAAPVRLECSGIVTNDHENPSGGFSTPATIHSIPIFPLRAFTPVLKDDPNENLPPMPAHHSPH